MKIAVYISLTLALVTYSLRGQDKVEALTATRQVWDFASELDLTKTQQADLVELKRQYENSRAVVRAVAGSNVPPDVQRSAQLAFNDYARLANRRIAELLTGEQKEKLSRLRSGKSERDVSEKAEEADGEVLVRSTAGTERRQPRSVLSEERLDREAKLLRAAYSKPSKEWPAPEIDESVRPYFVELGLLPPIPYPTNNPFTTRKAELGKRLFFDPGLSGSGQISCASCHDPDLAFADGRTVSFGTARKELKRNAPTILNVGLNQTHFWDGRASSLEQQASDVVHNKDEMESSAALIEERLRGIPGYTNDFVAVFGSPEVTMVKVAQAIATFERTISSRGNAFDSFLRGDTNALSDEAIRGLHLFRTSARCINCHQGPNFTDGRFHNEGLSYYGRKLEDLGRYEVTKQPGDVGAFKTPTLRNIGRTGPYMHNGLFDVEGVLNMYNAGMPTLRPSPSQKQDPLFPVKSPLLKPLGLNKGDLRDLKAFLEALSETRLRIRPPQPYPSIEDPSRPQLGDSFSQATGS